MVGMPEPFNPVWVTSCAEDMYSVSARHLIKSFLRLPVPGTLAFCYEKMLVSTPKDLQRFQIFDITSDPMLQQLLYDYQDVIPLHLGGAHGDPCLCPGGPFEPRDKRHKPGCVTSWFCRNMFRWFRKFVALGRVRNELPDRPVIWVDADCRFTAAPTAEEVESWFKGNDVFYLKGPHRAVVEGSVVGWRLDHAGGREALYRVRANYFSGAFRQWPRWDDCFAVQHSLAQDPVIPVTDLGGELGDHADVVSKSVLGKYLTHSKGRHGRELNIMK